MFSQALTVSRKNKKFQLNTCKKEPNLSLTNCFNDIWEILVPLLGTRDIVSLVKTNQELTITLRKIPNPLLFNETVESIEAKFTLLDKLINANLKALSTAHMVSPPKLSVKNPPSKDLVTLIDQIKWDLIESIEGDSSSEYVRPYALFMATFVILVGMLINIYEPIMEGHLKGCASLLCLGVFSVAILLYTGVCLTTKIDENLVNSRDYIDKLVENLDRKSHYSLVYLTHVIAKRNAELQELARKKPVTMFFEQSKPLLENMLNQKKSNPLSESDLQYRYRPFG